MKYFGEAVLRPSPAPPGGDCPAALCYATVDRDGLWGAVVLVPLEARYRDRRRLALYIHQLSAAFPPRRLVIVPRRMRRRRIWTCAVTTGHASCQITACSQTDPAVVAVLLHMALPATASST